MDSISVNILTCNNEKTIEACLKSVAWANEIIVFDSGSCDQTLAIVNRYTDCIHTTHWPGFAAQRERALQASSQDWVLVMDSDEALSPTLQQNIKAVLEKGGAHHAYRLMRHDIIAGHLTRFAGCNPIRLVKRNSMAICHLPVHESIITTEGSVGKLTGTLVHHPFTTLEKAIAKNNRYSTLAAEHHEKQSSITGAIGHSVWCFFKHYILKGGFLDRGPGFILAWLRAQQSFMRHIKRWHNQRPTLHLTQALEQYEHDASNT